MDNLDIRPSARPENAWTPLRDAVALVLKPLHARIAAALDDRAPQVGRPLFDPAEPVLEFEEHLGAPSAAPPSPQPVLGIARVQVIEDRDHLEILDPPAFFAEVDRTARGEPATVAEARALLADPDAALKESALERQLAWLVALAELRNRRADASGFGGTAA